VGGRSHGERGARTYDWGLGAVPPVGSRGKAPGQGGEAPLKLKHFCLFQGKFWNFLNFNLFFFVTKVTAVTLAISK